MSPITEFLRSLRRAPRALARTPAISMASIATLAIALGATTAIFSVFYSVVMRPLPFRDPDGLVQLNARAEDGRLLGVSQVELEDWATQVSSFESVALYGFSQFTLTDAGDPELLRGAVVSDEFFALLSAPIQLGRGLTADDDAAPNVVISDALWRVRFGGDPAVIGRSIRLNGQPYTIVGVAAATLRYPAVVAEIALAVVLLIGSALLGRSLYNLMQSGSGAENAGAVTVKLNLSGEGTTAPMMLVDRLLAEVAATPGVQAVGIASSLPPNISQMRTSLVARDLTGADQDVTVEIVAASGGVFTALGVPVLAGRTFSESDTINSSRVVILSRTASEKFFPDGDAVGRGLRVFASCGQPDSTVIGVVGDVKFAGMDAQPDGAIYVPHTQRSFRTQYLVVRAGGATGPAIQLIRKAVRGVDASLAMSDIRTVADLVTAATARPRFQSTLLALFALLALSLAGIGLYGVITHIVGQRAREFAVRLALGATPTDLLQLVLSKALVLSAIGAVIGTGLSLALARATASLLFGMKPIDAPSFLAAVLLALTIGLAAAVGPAIRAARLQPSATLRST